MRKEDVSELVRQATFLQRVGNPDIDFLLDLPEDPMIADCDGRQMSQALINILKNAVEAISTRMNNGEVKTPGRVVVQAGIEEGRVEIIITDNGCGLPHNDRHRLTEPYMTTREKGTGLGLAIVKKVMEDHDGSLRLNDAGHGEPGGARSSGAEIKLSFPVRRSTLGGDRSGQGGRREAAVRAIREAANDQG